MSFTRTFQISLGSTKAALTLKAQLLDSAGATSGSPITSGFTETGVGLYQWTYASFADAFRGNVVYFSGASYAAAISAGTVYAQDSINPEGDTENADVKTSTRGTSTYAGGAVASVTAGVTVSDKTGFKLASDGLAAVTVWTVAITGNITGAISGSVGSVASYGTLAADTAAAVWAYLTSAATTTGSIGKRIVDYLTGNSFTRLGAPAGASIAADIAAIGTGGSSTIIVTPATATVSVGAVIANGLTAYQASVSSYLFAVVDSTGTAINLTGKTLRFVAYLPGTPTATQFTRETGGSGITLAGASHNQVTVTLTTTNTTTAQPLDYALWNITDDLVLGVGTLEIQPLAKS